MNKLVKQVKIKLKEHQYKKYIDEHWLDEIDNAFNLKTSGINQPLSQDEIKEYSNCFRHRIDARGLQ